MAETATRPYPNILAQAYHAAYKDELPPWEEFADSLLEAEDETIIEDMAEFLYNDKFSHMERAEFDEQTGMGLYREHMEGPGFVESFTDSFTYSLVKSNPMMIGETAEAVGVITGSEGLEKTGTTLKEWAEGLDVGEPPSREVQDIDSVKSFFQWLGQAAGSGIGSTAAPIAAGAAGAMIGGPVGGVLGAAIAAAPMNMGEIYAQLKEEGIPKEDAASAALLANIPITALDVIGVERLLRNVPGSAAMKQALGQRLAGVVAGAGAGAATEGATEAGQSAIREVVAASMTQNPNVQERLLGILNEGAVGAVTGGAIGGVRGAVGQSAEQPVSDAPAAPVAAEEPVAAPAGLPAPTPAPPQVAPQEAIRLPEMTVGREDTEPAPTPEPATFLPRDEARSYASLILEEEQRLGTRRKIDPAVVKVGDRVLVDNPRGQPEEGTVSEASENLVRVVNDGGSPIGVYVPGVESDLQMYEIVPDQKEIEKQEKEAQRQKEKQEREAKREAEKKEREAKREAEKKEKEAQRQAEKQQQEQAERDTWREEATRAMTRIEQNPDDAVSVDAIRKLRNDKRFTDLPPEQRDKVDDFLLQVRQREELQEAAAKREEGEPAPALPAAPTAPDLTPIEQEVTDETTVEDAAGEPQPVGASGAIVGDDGARRDAAAGAGTVTQVEPTTPAETERQTVDYKPVKDDTVVTSAGTEHPVEYAVVEAQDLIASHDQDGKPNPAYPQQMQPRERGRESSQLQIQRLAQDIRPQLLAESPVAESGSPIIAPSGVVESGNARTIALKLAYDTGKGDQYRAYLEEQGYGVEGMNQPVLVRIRRSDLSQAERQAFTREANQPAMQGMSRTEQAFVDSDVMPEGILARHEGGDLTMMKNLPFVQAFIQSVVPAAEQTNFASKGGELSVEGRHRMEAALIAKAYDNRDLVTRLTESVEQGRATIKNALLDLSPRWARMREKVAAGELHTDIDQTQALTDAVTLIARNEETKTSIQRLLEPGLFPEETPELVGDRGAMMRKMLNIFYRNPGKFTQLRAAKDITAILDDYLMASEQFDPRQVDIFEGPREPAPAEMLTRSQEQLEQEKADAAQQEPRRTRDAPSPPETGEAREGPRRALVPDEGSGGVATDERFAREGLDAATYRAIREELGDIVSRMAPGVFLRTPSQVRDEQGRFVHGKFSPGAGQGIITVAMSDDPASTLRHEVIHALRSAGLFTDREWQSLTRAADKQGWLKQYHIKRLYPDLYDGNTPTETAYEEAIAFAFEAWSRDSRGYPSQVARVFARIREFFQRVIQYLRSLDFDVPYNSIFENVDTGVIGSRGWRDARVIAALKQPPDARGIRHARAYHSSPHVFEQFSTEAIGSGEGAQVYGWGLYFAGEMEVAQYYKDVFQNRMRYRAEALTEEENLELDNHVLALVRHMYSFMTRASRAEQMERRIIADFKDLLEIHRKEGRPPQDAWGRRVRGPQELERIIELLTKIKDADNYTVVREKPPMYEVDLAPQEDEYLLWDKPLSQQSPRVKKALEKMWRESHAQTSRLRELRTGEKSDPFDIQEIWSGWGSMMGKDYYRDGPGTDAERSQRMLAHGIKGIKYLDQLSRTWGEGTYNYVIFDAADVTIEDVRYSRPLDPDAPPPLENEESETRLAEAEKGIQPETLLNRLSDAWDGMRRNLTRHYPLIEKTPQNADVVQKLLHLESTARTAQDRIGNIFNRVVKGLSDGEVRTLTRYLVFKDLLWTINQGMEVGFGLNTVDEVAIELRKLQAKIDASPRLTERAAVRQSELDRLRTDLVDSGVLTPQQVKNPSYFRHQVLAYAKLRHAGSRGRKVSSAYWHTRRGSQKDINANYTQAEAEWMFKAYLDIATTRFLTWLKGSKYDRKPEYQKLARAQNRQGLQGILQRDEEAREVYGTLTQNVAFTMEQLRGAVSSASPTALLEVPDALRPALKQLVGGAGGRVSEGTNIFKAAAWLASNSRSVPLQNAALAALGSINKRKLWVRDILGESYVNPQDTKALIRAFGTDKDVAWQPDSYDGKTRAIHIFNGKSIPERMQEQMADTLVETWQKVMGGEQAGVSVEEVQAYYDSIKNQMMLGGPKHEMIVDESLAATLNEFHDADVSSGWDTLFRAASSHWKQWILFNPRRLTKYLLNNRTGDLDAILGNPSAYGMVKYIPTAYKELQRFYGQGLPTQTFLEGLEKGVVQSGMTSQEVHSAGDAMLTPGGDLTIRSMRDSILPHRLARRYFETVRNIARVMENAVRYAAYLHYRNEIVVKKKSLRELGYGATPRWVLEGVSDPVDLAAVMARDALGDYGNISATGKWARDYTHPFVSWLDSNTTRYVNLIHNAYLYGADVGAGRGVGMAAAAGAGVAAKGVLWGGLTAAKLYLALGAFYAAVNAWNNLLFSDAEEDMSTEERIRLHLHIGRWGGQVHTTRFQGALSDFLGWFGLEDAGATLAEVQKGRASIADVLKGVAKAPVNRLAQGLTPMYKTPIELALGRQFFPDVFEPRAIRDPWMHGLRTFSAEHEYAELAKMLGKAVPTRGYLRSLSQALIYSRDPGEMAYDNIRGKAYNWLSSQKGRDVPARTDARSRALYLHRKALRFGDERAEKMTRQLMRENKLTGENLMRSKKRAHPLGMLSKADKRQFLKTLTAREKDQLARASLWYRKTYWGGGE